MSVCPIAPWSTYYSWNRTPFIYYFFDALSQLLPFLGHLLVGKNKDCGFTQLVALQHLVELFLADGQSLAVRAVHHQDYKLKKNTYRNKKNKEMI